jgi:hypothetical protein
MATATKKPEVKKLEPKKYYIGSELSVLDTGEEWHVNESIEDAIADIKDMYGPETKEFHIFEVTYLGKAEMNITIKK